jgi:hypothetical protein
MANNCTLNVQEKLNNLYRLSRFQAPTGALEMAYSAQNGAEVQAKMIQANGKTSQYSITYAAPQCDTPIDCDSFDCTGAGTDSGTLTTCLTFTSFSCKSMPVWKNLPITSLRDLGSLEVQDVFASAIWDQMQKIKNAIDVDVVTTLCTDAGCVATGVDTKTYKLLNALGGPNFNVDYDILSDFADAGFSGVSPLLLGNRIVKKYSRGINAGGVGDAGVNLSIADRFSSFYDKNIVAANCAPTTEGNEVMLAALPGIVNVLSWSKNAGMFASRNSPSRWDSVDPSSLIREGESFLHTVVEDPATGHLFDLDLVYEPKCQKWQYRLGSYYKTLLLPVQGCNDSCFNGVVKYDVCPEATVTCD